MYNDDYMDNYIFSSHMYVQCNDLYVNNFRYMIDRNINFYNFICFIYNLSRCNVSMMGIWRREINIFCFWWVSCIIGICDCNLCCFYCFYSSFSPISDYCLNHYHHHCYVLSFIYLYPFILTSMILSFCFLMLLLNLLIYSVGLSLTNLFLLNFTSCMRSALMFVAFLC